MNERSKKLNQVKKNIFSSKDAVMVGLTYYELNQMVQAGLLIKEGRGLFVKKNAPRNSESEHYEIALAQLGGPSALCLWSALVFHDLTEEAPSDIWVYVPNEKTTKLKRVELSINVHAATLSNP